MDMKQKLESILNKGKMILNNGKMILNNGKMILHNRRNILLGGLIFLTPLTLGAQALKHYIEPRVGAIVPVSEKEQEYKPSLLIGGAYGFDIGKFTLEAGLDYFHSSGEYIKTNSFLPRVNVSFSPLKLTAKVKPYLTAGANLLSEFSTIDIPQFNVYDTVKNATFGLEAGVGVTIFDRIDARVNYRAMPASENVKAMIILTGGYRFRFGKKK